MKLISILFGLMVGFLFMIAFPYSLLQINHHFGFGSINTLILKITGSFFILVGIGLFLYCSRIFKKIGKGTPVPIEPPKKIVEQGLYQYSRNPIYWGYFAIVIGEALISGATLLFGYAVVFIIAVHGYVVLIEEPLLIKKFGDSYIDYTKRVPRWIPKRPKNNLG